MYIKQAADAKISKTASEETKAPSSVLKCFDSIRKTMCKQTIIELVWCSFSREKLLCNKYNEVNKKLQVFKRYFSVRI